MKACEYFCPRSIEEALALLGRFGRDARLLAGGTDLVIAMRRGKIAPALLVDLRHLAPLRGIARDGNIEIGALASHRDVETSALFAGPWRALAEASAVIGGHQIRNAGTIAGNLANASPAADTPPALLCLDAGVDIVGGRGTRHVALDDFFLGPGRTVLEPDEMIARIRVPHPPERCGTAFIKIGRRQAMEISVVCVAARVTLAGDGTCRDARLALGAVAPTPLRVPLAERILEGSRLTPGVLQDAAGLAAAAASPISDVRASAEYRRLVIEAIVPRAIRKARERAQAGAA